MRRLPIAYIDLILENQDPSILFGFRVITLYRNRWALVGGRMLFREDLKMASLRISREYRIEVNRDNLFLVGVSSVSFTARPDVSIAVAA